MNAPLRSGAFFCASALAGCRRSGYPATKHGGWAAWQPDGRAVHNDGKYMRTVIVSIPRSGHNVVYGLLSNTLKDKFKYCEYHSEISCCKNIPCSRGAEFQKNHDFDLDVMKDLNDVRYIVQIRSFIAASVSNFLLYTKGTKELWQLPMYISFAVSFAGYYREFLRKWVLDQPVRPTMVIGYHDLLKDPDTIIKNVLQFTGRRHLATDQEIENIVKASNISLKNDFREVPFFDPVVFYHLEQMVADEQTTAGLPLMMHKPTREIEVDNYRNYSVSWRPKGLCIVRQPSRKPDGA